MRSDGLFFNIDLSGEAVRHNRYLEMMHVALWNFVTGVFVGINK